MKNFIYFSLFTFLLGMTVSCEYQRENYPITISDDSIAFRSDEMVQYPQPTEIVEITLDDLNGLEASPAYQAFLEAHELTASQYFEVFTDTDEHFYAVDFYQSEGRIITLALYPKEGELYPLILEEVVLNEEESRVTLLDFTTYEHIGDITVLVNGTGNGDYFYKPTCRASNSNFTSCFGCSINELNSTPLGAIACATNPGMCIGAATIHCAPLLLDTV